MDARQREAGSWPAGATLNTYHLIDVPVTQPAGPVRLEARAYGTRTLEPVLAGASKELRSVALADASVTPPMSPVTPLRSEWPASHARVRLRDRAARGRSVATDRQCRADAPAKLYWRVAANASDATGILASAWATQAASELPTSAPMSSSQRRCPD